jgi:hypothetical protein
LKEHFFIQNDLTGRFELRIEGSEFKENVYFEVQKRERGTDYND